MQHIDYFTKYIGVLMILGSIVLGFSGAIYANEYNVLIGLAFMLVSFIMGPFGIYVLMDGD